MRRTIVIISLLAFFWSNAASGAPAGGWRDHLSYRRATHVAVTDNEVFCSAGAGISVFRKKDSSIEKLSKVNGLSDVDITSIKWSEESQVLVVGYANGNLDIIDRNTIINISDILRSQIAGSKSINNIMTVGNKAYLSCTFGIVVVNLERHEVIDTYFLGDAGIRLNINDIAFDGVYLYAATSSGLYKADINAPNLLDFSFWEHMDFIPEPGALFSSLAWFDNMLYAVQMSSSGTYTVFRLSDGSWSHFVPQSSKPVTLRVNDNYMALVNESQAEIFSPGPVAERKIDDYGLWGVAIRDAMMEADGTVWLADRIHGLVRFAGGSYNILTPAGPYSNKVFSITSYPQRTYFAAGGYNAAFNNLWLNGEYSFLKEGSWSSRLNYDIRDVLYVKEHPDDPDREFVATWGYGLAEYHDGEVQEIYNEDNSTLRSVIPGESFIRVGGIAFDKEKNLWLTNSGVPDPVSVRKANGDWLSFSFGGMINHDQTGKLIINSLGQKWMLLPRGGGLFVFSNRVDNISENDLLYRKISITDENNELISNEVMSIAEDQNGFIWVGLNIGVVVYYNPSEVFAGGDFPARRIVVQGSGEDDLGYLLNNETVTSIAVDGADRKWFGTDKSGVFLVSADGKQQIHHFTSQNSPLLSNTISDIAINPSTGEVFFGTAAGVVSFRGQATSPQSTFDNVYIFPNPVRESYEGDVTITGLVRDSVVKITDISGNLVYETVSLGGQAIWDGLNSQGHRAGTGIYLVFISTPDGSETHVSKIMFIH